ncbi:MAG: dienelactone hydrolase family protein [Actinobacteria bacterium]|nr:dienelactone hydrolase family protein [Actinomycetota bacterium]
MPGRYVCEVQENQPVVIEAGAVRLEGDLSVPAQATGVVLFAHGSGSSRFSPRNRSVASDLQQAGLGTLLIDLLTAEEEVEDEKTRDLRFDIDLLAGRVVHATRWLSTASETATLPVGHFGASTGAGAALVAAAQTPDRVKAVVSRGGRPDLAGELLAKVKAPTMLIVGSNDAQVIVLNRQAFEQLRCDKELKLVEGASHLFEEPGTLDQVAQMAAEWFGRYLR